MKKYLNLQELKELWKDKRRRKPYLVAILLVVLYIVHIFFLSDIIGIQFGLAGTVIHEIILAGIGVGVFVIFKGKLKVVFPFKKPELAKVAGTIILWIGTYFFAMMVTVIVSFFFPEEVLEASEGVNYLIDNISILMGIFVVAITPAICEEIAFRGALLGCFRGAKSKWTGIVIVSLIFGACHGSIWRMIPTAILGVTMGYILVETDNMLYNMLFHFVNNAIPVLLLGGVNLLYKILENIDGYDLAEIEATADARIRLASVATYVSYAGASLILIYVGNYLLHRGRPGYTRGVFPPEKKKLMAGMIGLGVAFRLLGLILIIISVGLEMAGTMRQLF